MNELLLLALPVPALIISSVTDTKTGKIPNFITFPCMALGFVLTLVFNRAMVFDRMLAMALMFLFGTLNLSGMGDIKLLMVVASVGGTLVTAVTLGLAAISLMIFKLCMDFRDTKRELFYGLQILTQGKTSRTDQSPKTAFAVYIATGYILSAGGKILLCLFG